MFSRFAALTGAVLVATGTAFTTGVEAKTFSNGSGQSDPATLIWRGDTGSRRCDLTAIEEGEVALSADGQWLQSEGEKAAVLGYNTFGNTSDTFRIKSIDSKVLFENGNDNQIGKGQFSNAEVQLSYDGGAYQQVWQNKAAVPLTNQAGKTVSGQGQMDVHVKTNGHKNDNGEIQFGAYVVKSTVVCIVD